MVNTIKNITDSPKSSFKAVLLAVFATIGTVAMHVIGAAVSGAANQFAATGNVTDWKPYAIAGVTGIGVFLAGGGLAKDIEPVKDAITAAVPYVPDMVASPVVNNITDKVAQAGIEFVIAKANEKLGQEQPALAQAITQALSAHQTITTPPLTAEIEKQITAP